MKDPTTGRSRGFGFLTFEKAETVNVVLVKEHFLDGKIVSHARLVLCSIPPQLTHHDVPHRSIPSAPSRAATESRRHAASSAASRRALRLSRSRPSSSPSVSSRTPTS